MNLQRLLDDARTRTAANAVAAVCMFVFVVRFFWPAPIGVMVQGLVIGGLTAMIAFGLALVYRSNRIINFAQGDLGGIPATLAVLLMTSEKMARNCATPSVATTLMSRGALRSRLTTPTSATAPMAPERARARGNTTQYGRPHSTTASPKNDEPNAPMFPCAKLMMRFVR